MKFIKKYFPFILILIFSFFAFKPILNSGFFPIHDDTQVSRVYEMTNALKDGMLPVRWSKDLGYGFGYPIFNFYDPLFYYIGGSIGLLGIDALISTKLALILSVIISGLSMYFLAKEIFGKKGALLSSLLYLLAPFHAVDIYIRGDFAESLAYAFIPLLFYGVLMIVRNYKWKYVSITAISYAFIILSHNLTAMMVSPFILLFIGFLLLQERKNKLRHLFRLLIAFLIGILLASFYFIPAVLEMKFSDVLSQLGGGANFRDHFVCISQLWTSSWGYGGSVRGCVDGISFMIGKYHVLLSFGLFLISVFFLLSKKYFKNLKQEKENLYLIIFLFLGFLVSITLMLEISRPIWELLKPMEFFQYPWRFLIMTSFFASLISGSLFWFLDIFVKNRNIKYLLNILIVAFIILVSLKFFVPQSVLNKSAKDYTSSDALNWQVSKISDEYMPTGFVVPKSPYDIPDISNLTTKELSVDILERKTQYTKLNLNVFKDGNYILPVAYFPAWKASIDGKSVNITKNPRGSLINFPKGKHTLELSFVQTPIERLANVLSLAGIILLFVGIIHLKLKV